MQRYHRSGKKSVTLYEFPCGKTHDCAIKGCRAVRDTLRTES